MCNIIRKILKITNDNTVNLNLIVGLLPLLKLCFGLQ